jgi:hypothetical protein
MADSGDERVPLQILQEKMSRLILFISPNLSQGCLSSGLTVVMGALSVWKRVAASPCGDRTRPFPVR